MRLVYYDKNPITIDDAAKAIGVSTSAMAMRVYRRKLTPIGKVKCDGPGRPKNLYPKEPLLRDNNRNRKREPRKKMPEDEIIPYDVLLDPNYDVVTFDSDDEKLQFFLPSADGKMYKKGRYSKKRNEMEKMRIDVGRIL